MLVRKFNPATDGPGALAVLQAGIQEQRLAARRTQPGHQEYRRIDLGTAYDETTDSFVAPETWYVAVDGQQIVGVLQIMAEADPRERLYKSHRLLLIQELDAYPKDAGPGRRCLKRRSGKRCDGGERLSCCRRPRAAMRTRRGIRRAVFGPGLMGITGRCPA